jgi:plastocyanin
MKISNRNLGKLALALVVAGAFITAGCGNSSSPTSYNNNNPPPSTPSPSSHFHNVSIQNFAFSPGSLSISVGDTVKWTNNDSAAHTVTSDTGAELQSSQIGQGGTYQHVFHTAGSFVYHCSIHTTMHGSVTVQ